MTTTKSLVTVKTISKKMVGQIRFSQYDWKEGSQHRMIWTKLMQDRASVVGWVPAHMVEKACKSLGPIWLVKIKADLFWWLPPDKGELFDKHSGPELEQLFID